MSSSYLFLGFLQFQFSLKMIYWGPFISTICKIIEKTLNRISRLMRPELMPFRLMLFTVPHLCGYWIKTLYTKMHFLTIWKTPSWWENHQLHDEPILIEIAPQEPPGVIFGKKNCFVKRKVYCHFHWWTSTVKEKDTWLSLPCARG